MSAFENSKWIWIQNGDGQDMYAEFVDSIVYKGERTVINLSCDSDYTLYVNGRYVASNQYGDYEHYKIYDTVELDSFLTEVENSIKILVYHCGVGTSRYRPAKAGLIFEILQNGKVTAVSREDVLSRLSPTYVSGNKISVSGQLGFTFEYDATKENEDGYAPSVCVDKDCAFFPRPIKKAVLLEKKPIKSMTRNDDRHCLIDLGGETVGVPMLDIVSDTEQTLTVAWGEHIADGCVRKTIGGRNFWFKYKTKKGRNIFNEYMLRLGCRYIEIFAEEPIEVNYAGVLPQVYETEALNVNIDGELDRRIYDICVNTLKLSMMEHYVDCPWREQALYSFDSRNQMLCGYYAFADKNAEYARANLKLIGNDRRDDGLLSICYPCGTQLAIPSFSLYYLFSMQEYAEHTGDTTLAKEMLPKLRGILDEFLNNRENGLVKKFEDKSMWNFYDWSPHLSGTLGRAEESVPDLMANCVLILAIERFEKICDMLGEDFGYVGVTESLRQKANEAFYNAEKGVFTVHEGKAEYTALGNAVAVLAKVVEGEAAERICDMIARGELIDCSLSMKIFVYEALLLTDADKYSDLVLSDIRNNYKAMLDFGSDTVWETIDGESAFENAGSLCHGWSAVPVYIFHKLGIAKK